MRTPERHLRFDYSNNGSQVESDVRCHNSAQYQMRTRIKVSLSVHLIITASGSVRQQQQRYSICTL